MLQERHLRLGSFSGALVTPNTLVACLFTFSFLQATTRSIAMLIKMRQLKRREHAGKRMKNREEGTKREKEEGSENERVRKDGIVGREASSRHCHTWLHCETLCCGHAEGSEAALSMFNRKVNIETLIASRQPTQRTLRQADWAQCSPLYEEYELCSKTHGQERRVDASCERFTKERDPVNYCSLTLAMSDWQKWTLARPLFALITHTHTPHLHLHHRASEMQMSTMSLKGTVHSLSLSLPFSLPLSLSLLASTEVALWSHILFIGAIHRVDCHSPYVNFCQFSPLLWFDYLRVQCGTAVGCLLSANDTSFHCHKRNESGEKVQRGQREREQRMAKTGACMTHEPALLLSSDALPKTGKLANELNL